jgi:hypothetical protein
MRPVGPSLPGAWPTSRPGRQTRKARSPHVSAGGAAQCSQATRASTRSPCRNGGCARPAGSRCWAKSGTGGARRRERTVPADLAPAARAACRAVSWAAPPGRPPERAQLVWQRALAGAGPSAPDGRFVVAHDLLRAAHHSPATMVHALPLGTNHLHAHPDDALAREGGHGPRSSDRLPRGHAARERDRDGAAMKGYPADRPVAARRAHRRRARGQAQRPERRQMVIGRDATSRRSPC